MFTQLYSQFNPSHYDLTININHDAMSFQGSVTITGAMPKSSKQIQLHAKDLIINSATVNDELAQTECTDDLLAVRVPTDIPVGDVRLTLEFSGIITDAMHGMYPCYFNHNGVQKKLIATQFESHHAREVFPCIDEPAAKATFALTLVTNQDETVLSNMPPMETTVENSKKTTVFETTPKMSTYLLAFVCGDMVKREATTKDGVVVRCWASAAQNENWLDYSVKETVALIEFYNDYFGVAYPLSKCDQVALPDFESGAMENWGLITYRETVLLSDPANPSLSTLQYITLVVAHELSHQWFGNLVTMKWWDDLWLNESFANMTEYLAADKLHPEWQIWEEFVAQDVASATNRDVYKDVQAVRVAVNTPEEIHTLFDPSIVYAKGGKLLKMLHALVGDDAWRTGLKHYFETHQYGNTTRDDLWKALETATPINIAALMNTWIDHPGQPLVTVSQQAKNLNLKQERLLLDGTDTSTLWQIPLLSASTPDLLKTRSETFQLETSDIARLNQSGIGHYIVHYTEDHQTAAMTRFLADPKLSSEWKITYLNGLVMLARYGRISLDQALESIKNNTSEPRAAVWSHIAGILGSARMIIEGDESLEAVLKDLTYNLSSHQLHRLGWEYKTDDPSNTTHLRTTLIGLAIASEHMDVIKQALALYNSAPAEQLPAEIRSMLLGVAVRYGNMTDFNTLIELYKTSVNADFKNDITAALCSTRKPAQAKILTKLMLDTSVVKTQDTIRWYIYLLRNRYVRHVAWDWLTTNWEWVMQQFGGSKSYDDFARYSASIFNTAEQLKQYVDFFEPKAHDAALQRAIKIGVNEITAKSAWRKRDATQVKQWLLKYSQEN